MLTKLRTFVSLYRQAGFRWSAFRLAYAFRLRSGLIRLQMPQYKWETRPLETWLKKNIPSTPEAYTQWRKQNSPKFFFDLHAGAGSARPEFPWNPQAAIDEADRVLSGQIKYFAHETQNINFPPNWHKDPVSGITLDASQHWSQLSDDGGLDVKFIWEANRFSMVYALVRAYTSSHDEKYAEAFWKLILNWADHNPPNSGPNWMDGQEISLRLMAWTFGFYAFLNSPFTTPEHIAQFTTFVATQAERIYKNIDYAISTSSNHTVSEACSLWTLGILFPELKDSKKYVSLGRRLLEAAADKQIFSDGSYSMYSLNYHRFVIHIYCYALRLGNLNHLPLSRSVDLKIAKSVEYMAQLIDPETGQMPVYGSNDGALVLPLNNCDFTDYRPLLQLASFVTGGKRLFESGPWDEDLYYFFGAESLNSPVEFPKQTSQNFSTGGVYVLRNTQSKAVIRCTDFLARPSHADQLHMDVWIRGQNIACDAGTYLYSGEAPWRNGLARTHVHNTVIVDSKDQMKMVSRFTWTDWAKGKVLQNRKNLWQSQHDGYKPVTHKRTVLTLEVDRWLVIDNLIAEESHHYALHWLFADLGMQELSSAHGVLLTPIKTDSSLSDSRVLIQMGLMEGNGKFSIVRADASSTRGWRSRYYGHKEPAISLMLEVHQPCITFWTFFGFENDVLELSGEILKINSNEIQLD